MYSIPTTTLSHAPFFPSLSPTAAATPQNHHLHPAATIVQPHQRGAVSFLEHPKKGALVLQFTHEGASGPGLKKHQGCVLVVLATKKGRSSGVIKAKGVLVCSVRIGYVGLGFAVQLSRGGLLGLAAKAGVRAFECVDTEIKLVVKEIEDGLLEEMKASHFGKEVMILEWMILFLDSNHSYSFNFLISDINDEDSDALHCITKLMNFLMSHHSLFFLAVLVYDVIHGFRDDEEHLVLLNAWESNCWCSKIDLLLIAFHTYLEIMYSFPDHCTSDEN
ncbi:hypothetical protein Tco_0189960 [Tanacetum coccineum]